MIQSIGLGTGIVKDLVIRTGTSGNQLRLYASDGSIKTTGDFYIFSTSDYTGGSTGALQVSGAMVVGKGSYLRGGISVSPDSTGSILTLNGAAPWKMVSVDLSNMYLQSSGTNTAFSFANVSGSILTTLDANRMQVTNLVPCYFSALSTRAVSIQNGGSVDLFVFDTVNHAFDVQGGRIINIAYPQLSTDAASKAYVDNLIKGLNLKAATQAASVFNVDLTRPLNTLDDVTLLVGYRVLLFSQTNPVENGIYTVLDNNMLTRADDMAVGMRAAGAFCFVEAGTLRGDKGYVCYADYPNDIVGTNALSFSQFNGNVISAGLGVYKDGNNVLNVNLDPAGSGLSFNGNYLRVDSTIAGDGLELVNGVLSVSVDKVGTVTAGTWQASVVQMAYGGTGNSVFPTFTVPYSDGTKLTFDPTFVYGNGALAINGTPNPNSAGDGINLIDRDLAIQGNSSGVYFADDAAKYNWSITSSLADPYSTLRGFAPEPWISISMSKDGSTVLLLSEPGSPSYISNDNGYNWGMIINDNQQHVWGEAVLSYDGATILMCASEEYLYVSRDGGATFNREITDFPRVWEWSSISDNGQYMLASALSDGMFASNDFGQTWTLVSNVPTDVVDLGFVHVCKDGTRQYAGYFGGALYESTDYGATFNQRTDVRSGNWYDMVEARDASVLVLYEDTGSVFVSNNGGISWSERLSDVPRKWVATSVSPDGSAIAVAEQGGTVHFSQDFGYTWKDLYGSLTAAWNFVLVADDDLGVVAGGNNVPVYLTMDGGATFSPMQNQNMTVPSAVYANGVVLFPQYNGMVQRYQYKPSSNLVINSGSDVVKANLQSFVVITDRQQMGLGYPDVDSGIISNTLDINGTLRVKDLVTFDTPLSPSSGGTGVKSLNRGIVLSNGGNLPFVSTGPLPDGAIPIGSSDGSGAVVLESGSTLRTHLGLNIGTQVQAWSAVLDNISSLTPLNNYFIMGTGSNFVMVTADSAASSMGLGNLAYLNTVNNTNWSGTPLSVANGGTGSVSYTTGNILYYNGSNIIGSGVNYDATNKGLAVNSSSVPGGSGLGVYGADVSLLPTTGNSTPSSILFHNVDTSPVWRLRRRDEGTGNGFASFVVSGGIPSADKNALVDRLSISSAGDVLVYSTTDSDSTSSTGALHVVGGVLVGKNVTVSGKISVSDTSGTSLSSMGGMTLAGGLTASSLNVSGSVTFSSTVDASSATVAGTVISGGLGVSGKIWNKGGMVVERSSAVGSRAYGATISADLAAWTASTAIVDANRHLSLVSNVSDGAVVFNMRNMTATNGWDILVEGGGNNRLVFQAQSSTAATTWMTLDSTNGSFFLNCTNDASSGTAAALYTPGGISCAKSVSAGSGFVVSGNVNEAVNGVQIANGNSGSGASSLLTLSNDTVNGAKLFLNSSSNTSDGAANGLTLRNNAGEVRVQASGSFGLTVAPTTGNVTMDGTVTVSSTADASSSTSGGAATIGGGIAVAKSAYVGGNLTVAGTVNVAGALTTPAITTAGADMVNVTSLTVKSSKMVTVNNQQMLYLTVKVSPTAASLNTQFTFDLPGRTTSLTESLDLDTGQCSGFTDSVNLVVLQNVLCTGVAGSTKAVVKFQSVSTSVHYLQVFVSYSSL